MRNAECERANHRVTENTEKAQRRKKTNGNTKRRFLLFCLSSLFFFFSVFSVTLWLALLPSASTIAAPPPSPPVPDSALAAPASTYHPPSDSETFAVLLLDAVNWVSEVYVRPVSRVELLDTAVTALYERARRPVPRDLRQRLERAQKQASTQPISEVNTPPAPLVPALAPRRPAITDDRPLVDLLRTVRADLGRIENMGGADPLHVGCQAMLHALDPYSGVITTKEDRRILDKQSERDGFGLEVPDVGERFIIRDVLPGSPAQQAGLRPGDEILRLHDSDDREREVKESLNVLNGRAPLLKPQYGAFALPQPITLTYHRPGDRGERQVTLEWRRFRPESVFGVTRRNDNTWNYWLDTERKIAQLRLGNLVENTPEELADILAALHRDGLRGLILDLRWCPGGALPGSTKTAELFLGEGTIATVRYRNRPEDVYRSTSEGKHNDFPMVVLINSESTGGAELIAAALQDHHRAVLIGQRTHGKGNVQVISPGVVHLKVTSGTIVRPNGKPLHRFPDSKPDDPWGVHPDPGHEFRLSAEASRALRTWWEELTMRPGSSTKRLPLDDPLADPQRNAALEALTTR